MLLHKNNYLGTTKFTIKTYPLIKVNHVKYFIFCIDTYWTMKTNSDGLFYCPKMCGRKYKSKQAVKLHIKYECGIKPQFQCSICGKQFKQPVHHRSHMLAIHRIILR